MLRFLLDADGLIFDFDQAFFELAQVLLGRPLDATRLGSNWDCAMSLGLNEGETDIVYSEIGRRRFASELRPLPGAVEGVKEIAEFADILFVTSPFKTSHTWGYDRTQALIEHFGELGTRVISTKYKYAVSGDVLVDDNVDHLREWSEEQQGRLNRPGLPVCWAYPHNEDCGFLRLSEWEPLIEMAYTRKLL